MEKEKQQLENLLNIAELAEILGIAENTVRWSICHRPERLPPMVRLPGARGPRWRIVDIQKWIAAHVEGGVK